MSSPSDRKFMGHMWIAKCKACGDLTAMSWEDKGCERDIAKSVARWIRRGDEVEKIRRYDGDPIPSFCRPDCKRKAVGEKSE